MVLTSRMILILKELMAAKSSTTSEDLAIMIHVTSRTIRNDIKELNKTLSTKGGIIKSTRGIGYELKINNSEIFNLFLQEMVKSSTFFSNELPDSPDGRVNFIIRKLLLENDFIKLDEIADELYISKSTIQNDLIEVKKILKSYKLDIEGKPYYGIKVIGNELDFRFCLSGYLLGRREVNGNTLSQMSSILEKEEISQIHTIILDEIMDNEMEISDISLNNLCIHFAIASKRIRDKNYVLLTPGDLESIYNQKEYQVANKIVKKIEIALNVSFPESEIAYIAIHLLGINKIANIDLNKKEFQSFVGSHLEDIIKEIIMKIDDRLKLGIKEDRELFVSLGLHLKPAINRYRYGMNMRNPMLNEIKSKYPLAFDSAIIASKVLKKRLEIDIDEDEIGYIALHISGAMLRQKIDQDVKRCIIVCASGVGSAMLLKYKLQSKYFHQLVVVDTIVYYRLSETSLEQIDFILTTIPIEEKFSVPVIFVNTLLGNEDFSKIEYFLQGGGDNQLVYLKEEHIYLQKEIETKEDVIKYLANKLEMAGYVDESFVDSVIERENLSSTSYGNLVAIPHPMSPLTKKTFWTICTLRKPIEWGDQRVQFVCLLSVEKNSTANLQLMYDKLFEIIEDKQKVKQLISYEEKTSFIKTMNAK